MNTGNDIHNLGRFSLSSSKTGYRKLALERVSLTSKSQIWASEGLIRGFLQVILIINDVQAFVELRTVDSRRLLIYGSHLDLWDILNKIVPRWAP